jgi:hypothetical protein
MPQHPSSSNSPEAAKRELEAIAPEARLEFLASQPRERQAMFKRILSPQDREKLSKHLLAKARPAAAPGSHAALMDAARNGMATTHGYMVEALLEVAGKLRPQDLSWIKTIDRSSVEFNHVGYSARQGQVICDIYRRYFPEPPAGPRGGSSRSAKPGPPARPRPHDEPGFIE